MTGDVDESVAGVNRLGDAALALGAIYDVRFPSDGAWLAGALRSIPWIRHDHKMPPM